MQGKDWEVRTSERGSSEGFHGSIWDFMEYLYMYLTGPLYVFVTYSEFGEQGRDWEVRTSERGSREGF